MSIIVLSGISELGSFSAFLTSLILAGLFQLLMGIIGFGKLGSFFPIPAIKALMTAIGLIIIFKQIPHGLGYHTHPEGEDSFIGAGNENTFTNIFHAIENIDFLAFTIFLVGIGIMIAMERNFLKKTLFGRFFPSSLLAVLSGIGLYAIFSIYFPNYSVKEHLVQLPNILESLHSVFYAPSLQAFTQISTYEVAITIALVGSIETLAALEATERLDPHKRLVYLDHELKIQGGANMFLGGIGGLPITTVILRSSMNVFSGAKTKFTTIMHGVWMLLMVLFFAPLINLIPLASLAGILVFVGYKLTAPSVYIDMAKKGSDQFIPFIITIIAIFFTNLLYGLLIGLAAGIIFVIKADFHNSIVLTRDGKNYLIRLARDVSFLNKAVLRKMLREVEEGSYVIIDGTKPLYIDHDIIEIIEDFRSMAKTRDIEVEIKKTGTSPNPYFLRVEEEVSLNAK